MDAGLRGGTYNRLGNLGLDIFLNKVDILDGIIFNDMLLRSVLWAQFNRFHDDNQLVDGWERSESRQTSMEERRRDQDRRIPKSPAVSIREVTLYDRGRHEAFQGLSYLDLQLLVSLITQYPGL